MKTELIGSIYLAMRKAEAAAEQAGIGFSAEMTASNRLHIHFWDDHFNTIYEKHLEDIDKNPASALIAIGVACGYAQGRMDAKAQPELPEVEFGPFVEIKTQKVEA